MVLVLKATSLMKVLVPYCCHMTEEALLECTVYVHVALYFRGTNISQIALTKRFK